MPVTARDICTAALLEIGVIDAAEQSTVSAADVTYALAKLNRLLDMWNAERAAVYAQTFQTFTLVPNLAPHTIGPAASSPTFTVTSRPVTLDSANLILPGPTSVYTPITVRDAAWWAAQSTPTIGTSIPTDVYFEPAWPLGQLFFWPVPTAAYQVKLELRVVLTSLVLSDTVSLPPGYHDAIVLSLAEQLARPFGQQVGQDLVAHAARARRKVWANNDPQVRISTTDAGIPGGSRGGGYFNYRTGRVV